MTMEKQIEEMVKIMNECCNRYDEQGNHLGNKCYECEEWSDDNHCCCSYNVKEAEALYNADYRKASDVAEEIFAEIEEMLNMQAIIVCQTRESASAEDEPMLSYLAMLDGRIYSLRVVEERIAELKKKYKGSEDTE